MDYNDVPLFVRVVEEGSFTAAAAKLGVQKSSVSRAVARLEAALRVRLLQRTTRRLALTDAGQAFFERARAAVAGVNEAAAMVEELGNEPRGVVRVTAPPDASGYGLGSVIAEFVLRHPNVRVDLLLSGRRVDLVAEGVDLAVRAGRLEDSSLVARRVGTTDLALFASPAYLERRGRPRTLADLSRHDAVLFRATDMRITWALVGQDGREANVEMTGVVTTDDMAFNVSLVAAGAGIGLLPMMTVRSRVEAGELEMVLPEYRVRGSGLHVVLPTSAFVPARVALLRDFLVERLSRLMEEAARACTKPGAASRSGPPPREKSPRRKA